MTNHPREARSPEDEAREWCNNYTFNGVRYWTLKEYVEGKDIEEYLPLEFAIMAHLAGQAVGEKRGYLRALEELNLELQEKFGNWGGPERENFDTILHWVWEREKRIINTLKSKGGA